jgi:hypothetical protein
MYTGDYEHFFSETEIEAHIKNQGFYFFLIYIY